MCDFNKFNFLIVEVNYERDMELMVEVEGYENLSLFPYTHHIGLHGNLPKETVMANNNAFFIDQVAKLYKVPESKQQKFEEDFVREINSRFEIYIKSKGKPNAIEQLEKNYDLTRFELKLVSNDKIQVTDNRYDIDLGEFSTFSELKNTIWTLNHIDSLAPNYAFIRSGEHLNLVNTITGAELGRNGHDLIPSVCEDILEEYRESSLVNIEHLISEYEPFVIYSYQTLIDPSYTLSDECFFTGIDPFINETMDRVYKLVTENGLDINDQGTRKLITINFCK
tara:strand:- start:9436 stop:10278 length:843 start_codon:yes stop_codon:yes gene_type:complete